MSARERICLLGFGEVGQTLAVDLRARGARDLVAWDVLFADAGSAPSRAAAGGLAQAAGSAAEAIGSATLVISAVTAAQCVAAARTASASLTPDAWYMDLNSVAPATKREAAEAIGSRRARYVEAAVMSPIGPRGIATPMLLGGPHAAVFEPCARKLGFEGATTFSAEFGEASAAKMCRSVIVKGMEALLGEALLAARHYRVESAVLESLQDLLPGVDWTRHGRYMISRSLLHGRRRAEEMREVARTVHEAGLDPWMSRAAAERQEWAAGHAEALRHEELRALLDAVLAKVSTGGERPA